MLSNILNQARASTSLGWVVDQHPLHINILFSCHVLAMTTQSQIPLDLLQVHSDKMSSNITFPL